jgi:hypothetical protein
MTERLTLSIGGRSYAIRRFKLGELRRLFAGNIAPAEFGFEVLRQALSHAEPPVEDPDDLEIGADEYRALITRTLEFAGMRQAEAAKPGEEPAGRSLGP